LERRIPKKIKIKVQFPRALEFLKGEKPFKSEICETLEKDMTKSYLSLNIIINFQFYI